MMIEVKKKESTLYAVVAHAFNPLALERQRKADLCESEASLVYKMSSRTTRAVTWRNPVLKNQINE